MLPSQEEALMSASEESSHLIELTIGTDANVPSAPTGFKEP